MIASTKSIPPVHPMGSRARVLLSSVFGPYAQDDEFGSRSINPMELYHNQVTRVQQGFSLRMFHRSWGLMLIQANLQAPCTLLDFPTLDRFVAELKTGHYDVVGIGAIIPNVGKVEKMCALVREHLPQATIVIGGHVANLPGLQQRTGADHVVRGEGVRWMRRFLGEDEHQPVKHPLILSGIQARAMGLPLASGRGDTAAALIPSVGCPMGCNFCSTSAMFGGRGKFEHFYETGDELFEIMSEMERRMHVRSFFVMDENFLLHRRRALRLLELMERHGKAWALYVFSSANVLRTYTMEQLIGLGIAWVWMGLEGKDANYEKLSGSDTQQVVRELRAHGICVVGSTIIGMENHAPENIDEVIEHAVAHDTEFHQFMLYTPIPGTPLHEEHQAAGSLLDTAECGEADAHGQARFNWRHPHIKDGLESEFLLRAFHRDFETNGPSLVRVARTLLLGWRRYKAHPDPRIRRRFRWMGRELGLSYAAMVWAARRRFRRQPDLSAKIAETLKELYREFGLKARLTAPLLGRFVRYKLWREERRLRRGYTYEPPFFRDTAQPAVAATRATPAAR